MPRYAIIRAGVVSNIVSWDGDSSKWTPGPNATAVLDPSGDAQIGGGYDGSVFTPAPPYVPVEAERFDQIGPKELVTAIIQAFRAEGVITAAKAIAIRDRIANDLKR